MQLRVRAFGLRVPRMALVAWPSDLMDAGREPHECVGLTDARQAAWAPGTDGLDVYLPTR